ncbi:MAG: hypothetical protein ACLQVD_11940 [Capsulimonadaceae bacterium]
MTPFFRLMGVVASACALMSRARINGFPCHIILLLVAGIMPVTLGFGILKEAPGIGRGPLALSVRNAQTVDYGDYVSVTGTVASTGVTAVDGKHYSILYDPKTRTSVATGPLQGSGRITVTGVAHPMPQGAASSAVGYNPVFLLAASERPAPPLEGTALFVCGLCVCLLICTSILLRHIVFQPSPAVFRAADQQAEAPRELNARYSGALRLSERVVGRFLDAPCRIVRVPNTGELAFVAQADASISTMNGGLINRSGTWISIVQPNSLARVECGRQFTASSTRPALRLRYTDASGKKPRWVSTVMSFESETERHYASQLIEAQSRKTPESVT